MTLKTTNALAAIQATLAAHFNEEAGPYNHNEVEAAYQHVFRIVESHDRLAKAIKAAEKSINEADKMICDALVIIPK